jgi:hypothetical protein
MARNEKSCTAPEQIITETKVKQNWEHRKKQSITFMPHLEFRIINTKYIHK